MNLKSFLERSRSQVEKALASHFDRPFEAQVLIDSMQYSLDAGGKRIRPALCFAAAQALGGTMENALPAACALEMVHTYSLIHDDLPAMDDDDLRRGKPTNHKVYGEALAILAGDGLLTEAFQRLSDPNWNISAEQKIQIVSILAEGAGCQGMVAGQVLDLASEGKEFTEETLQTIHRNKTGMLLRASVLAGGKSAGSGPEHEKALDQYGHAIGLAFQIADDILDRTATTEELGKDSGSDEKNNKATYPALMGIEQAKAKAQELLDRALSAVQIFGDQGEPLQAIARFIVERKS